MLHVLLTNSWTVRQFIAIALCLLRYMVVFLWLCDFKECWRKWFWLIFKYL